MPMECHYFYYYYLKIKQKRRAYSKARRWQQGMAKSIEAHCLGSDLKIETNQT